MPKMSYRREGDLGAGFKKFLDRANAKAVQTQREMMIYLTDRILALTPVWEGDSIVNWKWTVHAAHQGHIQARGQNIPTGHTNQMPLGSEPRRGINEEVVRQSLIDALHDLKGGPSDVYFSNNSETIVDLEYGLLPTPERSRSPHGIVRLAIIEVMGELH